MFLLRLRTIYDANLLAHFPATQTHYDQDYVHSLPGKKGVKTGLVAFVGFIENCISLLLSTIHPDANYEVLFHALEIIKDIYTTFGTEDYNYKRQFLFKGY